MKKFGLWLLKNNIHIMTLIFLCWAVWGICNWQHLALVQKLMLGMYAWLIVHEYEEGCNTATESHPPVNTILLSRISPSGKFV